jgi:hypothetical protein
MSRAVHDVLSLRLDICNHRMSTWTISECRGELALSLGVEG